MKPFDVYSIFDIEIVKAKGSVLWDKHGNSYLDLYGGHAVISIGHSHPHYIDHIRRQLDQIGFYSNSVKISQQEELAEKLGEASGYQDYQLFLCNSGAEANENAFKIASFLTGRKKIIAFEGAFHGRTSLAVAATDNPGIQAPVNKTDNVTVIPLNDLQQLEAVMDDSVCAVIIEGIQGVAGIRVPENRFLQEAASLCRRFGALLIVDEVQSGYGRSGKFFAHQWSGIRPDIITTAKGMGNGFPIAGVLLHPTIPAKKEMLGTTFGGNYLACAAAIAVLDVIKSENLIERAGVMGNYLTSNLQKVLGIKDLRGLGLMTGIELHQKCQPLREDLLFTHRVFTGSASNKNTIRLLPPLSIQQHEIDQFLEAMNHSLQSLNHEVLHNR